MNWQGKRVLVCGGAGMIGSHLSYRLLQLGAKVTVIDDLSSGSRANIKEFESDIEFVQEDLRVRRVAFFHAQNKDCIFQLAADMGGIGYITKIGAEIMFNSAQINMNMLQAAIREKTPQYFYSSSACVYPDYLQKDAAVTPLKETDAYPAAPDQYYGWEKLFSELMAEACARDYGLNIRVARFHNVYGSAYTAFDAQKGKVPCHLIIKAINYPSKPFVIWGDGEQTRSFLYIDDCVDGILALMDSEYIRPVNIGSDYLVTINQLAKLVEQASDKRIVPIHDLTKPQGVRGRNADLTLVSREVNWQPKVPLQKGIQTTYEWAIKHYDELEGLA